MRLRSSIGRILASGILALGLTGVPAPTIALADTAFGTPTFTKVINGDFGYVGNTSLRCPDENNACLTASKRGGPPGKGNNNDYQMTYADVDSDSATFDSSSAQVTIPKDTRVSYAQLSWNGVTLNGDTPCQTGQGKWNGPPSGGTAEEQNPTMVFTGPDNKATPIQVDATGPNHVGQFDTDQNPAGGGGIYFTDYQVYDATNGNPTITQQLQLINSLPQDTPLTVTVGNIWTLEGPGCSAGWSLILVYEYAGSATPPPPKNVLIYNGHENLETRNQSTDLLTVDGFDAPDVRIGLTTSDGDWGYTGDEFLINNTAQLEPSTKLADNFFLSNSTESGNADGLNPPYLNNFGLDAKTFTTSAFETDSKQAKFTFATGQDEYLVQNIAISIPVPGLTISTKAPEQPVSAGGTATFTSTVTNTSQVEAGNIGVSWDGGGCAPQTLDALATGATHEFTCAAAVPSDAPGSFTSTATVSWDMPGGAPRATASAAATATIVHPSIGVALTAGASSVRPGGSVTFTADVTNTSADADLHDVAVSQVGGTACAPPPIGDLAHGAHQTVQCAITAGTSDIDLTVQAAGAAVDGTTVSNQATATAQVIQPQLTVVQKPSATTVRAGEKLTYTTTVTNSGDTPLTNVAATNTLTGLTCDGLAAGTLAPAAGHTITCTSTPTQDTKTLDNTITATGTAADSKPVTAEDGPDPVTVIHPAISVTITPKTDPVAAGDPATFTVTVSNDSPDTKLSGITVTQATPGRDGTAKADSPCAYPAPGTPARILAPKGQAGATLSYECTVTMPTGASTYTTAVTATGTADDQKPISHQATATFHVQLPKPALRITKTADAQKTTVGTPVTFAVEIENTGSVPLTVEVTDQSAPDCGFAVTGKGLVPGARQQQNCTVTPGVIGTLSNVATFTARQAGTTTGDPITGSSATVQVEVDPASATSTTSAPVSQPSTSNSSASQNNSSGVPGKLASTGVSPALPAMTGFGLLLAGALLCLAGKETRPRARRRPAHRRTR